jgi:hypothetical protein
MTHLLKAAVADNSPRKALQARNDSTTEKVRQLHQRHKELREGWGRNRWPLLVAARGRGDPTVTAGQFIRQPQGTGVVNSPTYAANWHDQKPLGHYDYVFGGKGGGIYGGGPRLAVACVRASLMVGIVWRRRCRDMIRL